MMTAILGGPAFKLRGRCGSGNSRPSPDCPVEKWPKCRVGTHNRSMNNATRIRATSPTDMLSLVPYLMGFHVEDGVVVLVCSTGSVEVALRLDHWMFTDPMAVLNRVEGIIANVHDPKLFLVGYGPDRDLAEQSLALLETGFAPEDLSLIHI